MLTALGGLMCIGVAFIYSATMVNESASLTVWYNQPWLRQIIWYGLGVAAAASLCLVDYHILARWSLVAYGLPILLVVAGFAVGSTRVGARRWVGFGFFLLHPSEFADLALFFRMAH